MSVVPKRYIGQADKVGVAVIARLEHYLVYASFVDEHQVTGLACQYEIIMIEHKINNKQCKSLPITCKVV